jgi:hypothetical protein
MPWSAQNDVPTISSKWREIMPSYIDADASSNCTRCEPHVSAVLAEGLPADTTCPACYEAIVRLGNAVQTIAEAIQCQTTPVSVRCKDDLRTGTQTAEGEVTPSFYAYRWIS